MKSRQTIAVIFRCHYFVQAFDNASIMGQLNAPLSCQSRNRDHFPFWNGFSETLLRWILTVSQYAVSNDSAFFVRFRGSTVGLRGSKLRVRIGPLHTTSSRHCRGLCSKLSEKHRPPSAHAKVQRFSANEWMRATESGSFAFSCTRPVSGSLQPQPLTAALFLLQPTGCCDKRKPLHLSLGTMGPQSEAAEDFGSHSLAPTVRTLEFGGAPFRRTDSEYHRIDFHSGNEER